MTTTFESERAAQMAADHALALISRRNGMSAEELWKKTDLTYEQIRAVIKILTEAGDIERVGYQYRVIELSGHQRRPMEMQGEMPDFLPRLGFFGL